MKKKKQALVSNDFGWIFWGCDHEALVSLKMKKKIGAMVAQAGFTVHKNSFTKFDATDGEEEGGYTSVITIGESCVDIHTWPKHRVAHVRIFYCNFTQCNAKKKDVLLELLGEALGSKEIEPVRMRQFRIEK